VKYRQSAEGSCEPEKSSYSPTRSVARDAARSCRPSFRADTAQASGLASRCKLCEQRPLPGVELVQKHENQGGKCAICQSDITIPKTRVDHCHATGIVRDLLCNNCNCGLGFFADDPARMRNAAAYIERHRQLTFV
jgi:hypothetical protein